MTTRIRYASVMQSTNDTCVINEYTYVATSDLNESQT